MKNLDSGLLAHLIGGETTMVHCWKIVRTDGTVQGFTEHDRDLTFESVTYRAATGFSSTKMAQSLGLAVDNLNAEGILSAATITEEDLSAGRYDDAEVELYWVNYNNVVQRWLKSRGYIGQTKRSGAAFSAEFRSLASRLQQKTGRIYQQTCDTTFGSTRCGIDLSIYTETGTVVDVSNQRLIKCTGPTTTTENYFEYGVLKWTSGNNNDLKFGIKSSQYDGVNTLVELWEIPPYSITVSDNFEVVAGCDKYPTTCAAYGNIANFQGFLHIPGSDFLNRYAIRDSSQQGESLYGN